MMNHTKHQVGNSKPSFPGLVWLKINIKRFKPPLRLISKSCLLKVNPEAMPRLTMVHCHHGLYPAQTKLAVWQNYLDQTVQYPT